MASAKDILPVREMKGTLFKSQPLISFSSIATRSAMHQLLVDNNTNKGGDLGLITVIVLNK